jgi:hypothetical protein
MGYYYKKFWEELTTYFPLIRHGPYRKRRFQRIFVAAGTCLPSRCLATIGGTHGLMGEIYHIRHLDGLRCHGIHDRQSKVDMEGYTDRQHGDRISLLYESRLKTEHEETVELIQSVQGRVQCNETSDSLQDGEHVTCLNNIIIIIIIIIVPSAFSHIVNKLPMRL